MDQDATTRFPRSAQGKEHSRRTIEIDELQALCRLLRTRKSDHGLEKESLTRLPVKYEILHERKLIEVDLQQLKLALSDQNLELLPDYEQRVDVLKHLQFIDENATVLLKGRVACEVRKLQLRLLRAGLICTNVADQLVQRARTDGIDFGQYLGRLHGRRSCCTALCFHLCRKDRVRPRDSRKGSAGMSAGPSVERPY